MSNQELKALENKQYLICGVAFTQRPITIRQFRAVMEIIGEFESADIKTYEDLLANLTGGALTDFMSRVIFPNQQAETVDWEDVTYEVIDEVVSDFFGLNPRLKKRLNEFFGSLKPMMLQALTQAQAS